MHWWQQNPNQVNTSKDGESQWILRYPMINGNFNENSYYYESREEILGIFVILYLMLLINWRSLLMLINIK